MAKIVLKGVSEFKESMKGAKANINAEIKRIVTNGAFDIEKDAKLNCPVGLTDRLRSSITTEIKQSENAVNARIGSNVDYAPYIEFGTGIFSSLGTGRKTPWRYFSPDTGWHFTRGHKPKAYLYPAFSKNFNRINQALKDAIGKTK